MQTTKQKGADMIRRDWRTQDEMRGHFQTEVSRPHISYALGIGGWREWLPKWRGGRDVVRTDLVVRDLLHRIDDLERAMTSAGSPARCPTCGRYFIHGASTAMRAGDALYFKWSPITDKQLTCSACVFAFVAHGDTGMTEEEVIDGFRSSDGSFTTLVKWIVLSRICTSRHAWSYLYDALIDLFDSQGIDLDDLVVTQIAKQP